MMELPEGTTINPLASAAHIVVLGILIAIALGWLSWKSARQLSSGRRLLVLVCRLLLVAAVVLFFLNPGNWVEDREATENFWTVLVDRSQSMQTIDQEGEPSRWEIASSLVEQNLSNGRSEDKVDVFGFAQSLDPSPTGDLSGMKAEGEATDLLEATSDMINLARNRGGKYRGSVVITDGRQTSLRRDLERVALRARAKEAPFYVIPLGGKIQPKDLQVTSSRRQFVAFAGQECHVSAKVKAQGLGSIRPTITLRDSEGNELDSQQVELQPNKEVEVRFSFPAPSAGIHLFSYSMPEWQGERVTANNSADFTLSILDGKMKIFMAEGSPYWDSKFLAQMIRRQENMEITSVYRISSDHFFRIQTGDEVPVQEKENIFPSTAEDLARYDLIVLGKGCEYFLDAKRLGLLSEYLRDRGGAVLFTRGKPYSGTFEGLEFLEPIQWGGKVTQPFQLMPTLAGEASGLFGELLPGREAPVWQELPNLEESHHALSLKPFTDILLEGSWSLDGKNQTLPLLVSRRFGRGMTAVLNVDGMWKWDFFPADEGVEGQYETFWSQLINWTVTYSEFLPGQDLSLHLDKSIIYPGDLPRARVGYRGDTDPNIALKLYNGDFLVREIPAARPSETSSRWEAGISLNDPGSFRVEAFDRSQPDRPGPSLPITVLPPPGEADRLSADRDFLEEFAQTTGGRLITPEEIPTIVAQFQTPDETVDRT
ncbi:MAG: vWA domain-containing protein, partial [Verrucomicrobiota bacterium]